jgi:DNA topoisomerase-1
MAVEAFDASVMGALAAARDATAVGLCYVDDFSFGLTRRRRSDRFEYFDVAGARLVDETTLARIRRIAIPPAWEDVWIAPRAECHIQAVGRDLRGRKQYRYHHDFRAIRDGNKFAHLATFAKALPRLRRAVGRDMRRRGLPREKVLAAVVSLLDRTLLRIGNDDYARQNGSYGLSTLRDRHVEINGETLHFAFKGKSGKYWNISIRDRRVAHIVKSCQDLPGQHLFQYLDEAGEHQAIGSADVNGYLRAITSADITAKDFRTWAGTVLAAKALTALPPFNFDAPSKANLREAVQNVAAELGNTPAVCRKCYIHPAILEGYTDGSLFPAMARNRPRRRYFDSSEAAVLAYLNRGRRFLKKRRGS